MERPEDSGPSSEPSLGDPLGWDRQATWCLVLLVLGALLSLVWWSQDVFDPENDACMYIQVARNLLAGEGFTLLGEPFGVRPPGFSVLIAPLMAIWGTHVPALNLFVNLFGVACIALLFAHTRARLGSPIALALSVLLWINPGFRSLCNQIMSDVPGMGLALGCLLLERSWRPSGPRRAMLLGIAIGLAGLVRTLNLLLVPSILAATYLRRGDTRDSRVRGLLMILGTLLVSAPWSVRNARTDFTTPAEQTFVHSYGAGMFHQDARDPNSPSVPWDEIVARAPAQLSGTVRALGSRFGAGELSTSAAWLGSLSLLCIALVALRRKEPAEFLCLGLLVIVALYFAFDDRLVLPIFVLGLPAVAEVSRSLLSRIWPGRAWTTWVMVAGLAGLGLFDLTWMPDLRNLEAHARSMERLAGHVEEQIPAGVPIGMRVGGELAVYSEERTIYSMHFVTRPGSWRFMDPFLEERGIDHCVFFEPVRDEASLSPSGRRKKRRADQIRSFLRASFREVGQFDGWWIYERR